VHLPDSTLFSWPGHMLLPVPPGIPPCSPIDSPDFRYLNHGHAPLPNPLKRHLNIKQHDKVWFSDAPPAAPPSYPTRNTQPTVLLDTPDTSPFPSLASMDALPVTVPPSLAPAPAPQPSTLAAALASSSNKLFFVSYLPEGTACPCWCLV
jgi:hypothetical protein